MKKQKEEARKVRQAEKQQRRQQRGPEDNATETAETTGPIADHPSEKK
jgi:hypothetical protein